MRACNDYDFQRLYPGCEKFSAWCCPALAQQDIQLTCQRVFNHSTFNRSISSPHFGANRVDSPTHTENCQQFVDNSNSMYDKGVPKQSGDDHIKVVAGHTPIVEKEAGRCKFSKLFLVVNSIRILGRAPSIYKHQGANT